MICPKTKNNIDQVIIFGDNFQTIFTKIDDSFLNPITGKFISFADLESLILEYGKNGCMTLKFTLDNSSDTNRPNENNFNDTGFSLSHLLINSNQIVTDKITLFKSDGYWFMDSVYKSHVSNTTLVMFLRSIEKYQIIGFYGEKGIIV